MSEIDPSVWQRYGVLARLARRHPACATSLPPGRAELQPLLERGELSWVLVDPGEVQCNYEGAVGEGRIPVREASWHDVFNVLAFVRFPRAKASLHARVLERQRERLRSGTRMRSREEDALTLLDEAVIVIAGRREGLARLDEIRPSHDLARIEACIRAESLFAVVFGHALLEHLVYDRPQIGAGVLTLALPDQVAPSRETIDAHLARTIAEGRLEQPTFAPTLSWPATVHAWCR